MLKLHLLKNTSDFKLIFLLLKMSWYFVVLFSKKISRTAFIVVLLSVLPHILQISCLNWSATFITSAVPQTLYFRCLLPKSMPLCQQHGTVIIAVNDVNFCCNKFIDFREDVKHLIFRLLRRMLHNLHTVHGIQIENLQVNSHSNKEVFYLLNQTA